MNTFDKTIFKRYWEKNPQNFIKNYSAEVWKSENCPKDDSNNSPTTVIVDGEDAIQRLYGGYLHDFVNGGDWSSTIKFLMTLSKAVKNANLKFIYVFDGTVDFTRISDWAVIESERINKANSCYAFMAKFKNRPPPNNLWIPPSCASLIIAKLLTFLKETVRFTSKCHQREIISLAEELSAASIMADNPEYAFHGISKILLASSLTVSFQGVMKFKEINFSAMSQSLKISNSQMGLFGTLLGNAFVPKDDYKDFYCELLGVTPTDDIKTVDNFKLMECIANYVSQYDTILDIEKIGQDVFSKSSSNIEKYAMNVKQFEISVCFYCEHDFKEDENSSVYKTPPSEPTLKQTNTESMDVNEKNLFSPVYVDSAIGYGRVQMDSLDMSFKSLLTLSNSPVNGSVLSDEDTNLIKSIDFKSQHLVKDRVAFGAMHPWIANILFEKTIKIGDHWINNKIQSLPNAIMFYRKIRSAAYGILCNMFDLTKDFTIKEIFVDSSGKLNIENVQATYLDEGRNDFIGLWWNKDFNKERLIAFSLGSCCSNGVGTMNLLNEENVPKELIYIALVLRYIIVQPTPLITAAEFTAILAMACDELKEDTQYITKLIINDYSPRIAQLGNLIMSGIEHFMFLSDVCGKVIPQSSHCPQKFFNGKLLQHKINIAKNGGASLNMCNDKHGAVLMLEKMRNIILSDLKTDCFLKSKYLPPRDVVSSQNNNYRGHGMGSYMEPRRNLYGNSRGRSGPRRRASNRGYRGVAT